jgi:hypothetical protein
MFGEEVVSRIEEAEILADHLGEITRCDRSPKLVAPSQSIALIPTASNKDSPSLANRRSSERERSSPSDPNTSDADTQPFGNPNSGHARTTRSGTSGVKRGNRGYQKRPSTARPRTRVAIARARDTASRTAKRWLQEPLPRRRVRDAACYSSREYTGRTVSATVACARRTNVVGSRAPSGSILEARARMRSWPASSIGVGAVEPATSSDPTG